MLLSVPRLNPAVRLKELDTGQLMMVYEKAGNRTVRFLRKVFAIPEVRELLLDVIGAKVVGRIDGKRNVLDIIAYVAGECKISRKEAEVALLKYLNTLGRRNLVGFELRN